MKPPRVHIFRTLAREAVGDAVRRRIVPVIAVVSLLSLLMVDSCTSCGTPTLVQNGVPVELPGIADGSWELSAEKQGYAASKKSVQIQHDRSQDSLRMELDPTEGVSLEVRLPTGGAPDEVRLAVMSGESALVRGTYSTGENGSVRVSTVPPGQWDMVVSAPGTAAGTFRVQAPGPRVPVQLRPATTLTIEVPALSGTERYATVRLSGNDGVLYRGLGWSGRPQSSWQMRGGRLDLTTLPPGAWTVTVEGRDGRRWSGTTNTAQGAPASLVLESGD